MAIAVAGALCVGLFQVSRAQSEAATMKRDFTIFLDAPIAVEGGAIVIVPTEVAPPIDWDATADAALNYSLTVKGQVSIVELQYPKGMSYVYRFRSANEQAYPSTGLMTERVSIGSRWDVHPETGEEIAFETVLVHHIEAPRGVWKRSDTSGATDLLELAAAETRYPCEVFEGSRVCDASQPKAAAE